MQCMDDVTTTTTTIGEQSTISIMNVQLIGLPWINREQSCRTKEQFTILSAIPCGRFVSSHIRKYMIFIFTHIYTICCKQCLYMVETLLCTVVVCNYYTNARCK